MSQEELARKLRVRPETLGKVIDRLKRSTLIIDSGSSTAKRGGRVLITPAGRDLLNRVDAFEEEQERTFGSDEQLRAELINRIRSFGLDAHSDPAPPPLKLVPKNEAHEEDGTARPSATG